VGFDNRQLSGAYLGVTFDTRYQDEAVVQNVRDGSPAERAGLQAGDHLVRLNGRRVSSAQQATNLIRQMQPGERLEIEVARHERLDATLGSQPDRGAQVTYEEDAPRFRGERRFREEDREYRDDDREDRFDRDSREEERESGVRGLFRRDR
jgi:predicted metalloprotease with PDZ domain